MLQAGLRHAARPRRPSCRLRRVERRQVLEGTEAFFESREYDHLAHPLVSLFYMWPVDQLTIHLLSLILVSFALRS